MTSINHHVFQDNKYFSYKISPNIILIILQRGLF